MVLFVRPGCGPTGLLSNPIERLNSWESSADLSKSMNLLLRATAFLKDGGLSGLQIMRTWAERRVLPLWARDTLMSDYHG